MLLAHRLASARACLAGRSPLIVRTCVTYVPSKKPFVYYVEKDGQQVPLDLESPDAPQWHDNNDDFWRKADLFVQDQPEVHPPYHHMKWALGLLGFGSLFYFVFLQDGSAGRAWCDGWTNQDKYLMFGMDPGEYLTKEDREVIAKRREIARKLPLLTRLAEIQRRNPLDIQREAYLVARDQSRLTLGIMENKMRRRSPQQVQDATGNIGFSLIHELEMSRTAPKPDISKYKTPIGGTGPG